MWRDGEPVTRPYPLGQSTRGVNGKAHLDGDRQLSLDDIFFIRHIEPMRDQALADAILAAGSVAALAEKLGITKQAVSSWDRVPMERARSVAAATGVSIHRLRPDVWPVPEPESH